MPRAAAALPLPLVLPLALLALGAPRAAALNNGLALTPQMGWNSWNHFACNVSEALIRQTADLLVSTGLSAVGYEYVNVDDCWAGWRDSEGFIHEDNQTFPSGMAALAAYVHARGLKFGLYSDAGYKTCAGRPGSLGFETQDAESYARWGVDYLKYDNCNTDGSKPEQRYPVMRDALNATGRAIFFSMCEWGVDNPATWAAPVGNSWRTTGDISDNWASMTSRIDQNDLVHEYAAPGGWNDPDMLEVGNGGLTSAESVAHFSLWALAKAPLLIGCDLASMSNETLAILTNREVIAVNQDPLGVQGYKRSSKLGLEVWAGPLVDDAVAVVLFNRRPLAATITFDFALVGAQGSQYAVRDLWLHKDLGLFQGQFSYQVDAHGAAMLKLSPASRDE